MFKKCLENCITHRSASYKCYLCHYETSENRFDSMIDHIETDNHKQKLNKLDESIRKNESKKFSTISESQRRIIVENHVTCNFKSLSSLYCHICKCSISGLSNSLEHIKGGPHKQVLKEFVEKESIKIGKGSKPSDKETKTGKKNDVIVNNGNSLVKKIFKCESASHFVQIRHCEVCQMYITNDTLLKCHCMLHLFKELPELQVMDIIQYKFFDKNKVKIIKCLLCNKLLKSDVELQEHLTKQNHLDRLELFQCFKNVINIEDIVSPERDKLEKLIYKPIQHCTIASFCKLCEVSMGEKNIRDHSGGKKHMANLEKNIDISNKRIEDMKASNFYTCFICETSFPDVNKLFRHYEKFEHKAIITNFNMIRNCSQIGFIKIGYKEIFYCSLCKINIFNCFNVIEHINGKKHQASLQLSFEKPDNNSYIKNENTPIENNEKDYTDFKASTSKKIKKSKEFETNHDELIKLGFSAESVYSLSSSESNTLQVDDVLNDLVQLDLDENQQKKLPKYLINRRKVRTPNTEQKKNSFSKNVLEFGRSFITLCIEFGEANIYKIDPEKLRLIELGIHLTFPWETERICLSCTQQFPCDKQSLFEHLNNQEHIKNLREMEVNDKDFEDYPDQFSDLKLAKFFMIDESDDWVQCYACNIKIKNNSDHIYSHISSPNHIAIDQTWKKLSDKIYQEFSSLYKNIWYYAQVFICEVCNAKFDFEIEFVKHIENPKHRQKVDALEHKGIATAYDVCPICITYWYGKSDIYSQHCESKFHKRFAKNGDFTVPNMTATALDLLNNVDKTIDFLKQESDKVLLENEKEFDLLYAIEKNVKRIYPNARAYTFGSRLSKLGFPDSDVDVFLDCENVYYKSTSQEKSQNYLTSIKTNFETKKESWMVDEILLATRIPIMKLRHLETGLKCDISFTNGLGVEKSSLIGQYNLAYPICRELILYLKRWLTLCQLTGSDCITTFAISWYVIFYLQTKGILPPVHRLIKLENKSKLVDGWECGFQKKIPISSSDFNFKDHLKEFFSYYADFDYQTKVACPYLGKTIQKSLFAHIDQLPEEMEIYKSRVRRNDLEIFRFDSPMCIQDPIDLSQNITKAVKKLKLRCFKQYCLESAAKIDDKTVL